MQAGERSVFGRGPRLALDDRVQVAPPAAHALLVCTPLQLAADLGPRIAMQAHQLQQPLVLLLCPLLLLDVGVHLPTAPTSVLQEQRQPTNLVTFLSALISEPELSAVASAPGPQPQRARLLNCAVHGNQCMNQHLNADVQYGARSCCKHGNADWCQLT